MKPILVDLAPHDEAHAQLAAFVDTRSGNFLAKLAGLRDSSDLAMYFTAINLIRNPIKPGKRPAMRDRRSAAFMVLNAIVIAASAEAAATNRTFVELPPIIFCGHLVSGPFGWDGTYLRWGELAITLQGQDAPDLEARCATIPTPTAGNRWYHNLPHLHAARAFLGELCAVPSRAEVV